jgi:hypothetical protein
MPDTRPFKNFAEYEAVAANISLVMGAIDSQTKVFTDPPTAIQQELEEATAAKNIPNSEKKKLLRSLTLALRAAQLLQFRPMSSSCRNTTTRSM